MKTYLDLICDYNQGDLAWAEILKALAEQPNLPERLFHHLTTVPAFDTMATGFVVAQLGLGDASALRHIIFANTAPRKDRRSARRNNAGEGLLWGKLTNGVEVLAVNSGYSLSFVRDQLVDLRTTMAPDRGSQFRSRDFFPQVIAALAAGDRSFLRRRVDRMKLIPDLPPNAVAYVDNFGNLKTTVRTSAALTRKLAPGARVQVTINGTVRTASVASGSFNVKEGDLAFAPGSSGHGDRFWELFKRGGSAFEEFHRPPTGSTIIVSS